MDEDLQNVSKVKKETDGTFTLDLSTGGTMSDVNCLLWAIGRLPNSDTLGLDKVGVDTDKAGHIIVDEFQNTSKSNIYALGDVCGKALLTPAGRRLAHRLFDNKKYLKLDYSNIPTVVFSHPPIGTIGYTQGIRRPNRSQHSEAIMIHNHTIVTGNMSTATPGCYRPEAKILTT